MTRRTARRAVVVLVIGLATAGALALGVATPMEGDLARLVSTAFAAALVPGVAGMALLWALRRRSIQSQAIVVALVSVAGTLAGVLVASRSMFLSSHDRDVLVVVMAAAATIGVLAALVLGERVGKATTSLTELTRRIGAAEGSPANTGVAPEEFMRLGQELTDMHARLEEAEVARRELFAWMSHDLRTPMAGIRVLVEALEDGVADDAETEARYHRALREQTDRLASLVDELFELSRLRAGAVKLQLQSVTLEDLVAEAVAGIAPSAGARNVELDCHLRSEHCTFEAAPREMGRVLQNLLENAVRHTPEGGQVVIESDAEDGWVALHITDSGSGIPTEDLERIFDAGYMVDRARTPPAEGSQARSGLGLAIASGFVELHGGTLSAMNTGTGARFSIRVPLRGQPVSAARTVT